MLEIFFSWVWIAICSIVIGYATILLLKKAIGEVYHFSFDMVIITGLCVLTVYAQIFSLFYKVGMIANLVLLMVAGILFLLFRKSLVQYLLQNVKQENLRSCFLVIIVIGVIVLFKANQTVDCYDSYLYHAQTIRWMEEYRVIPGLGNLHTRFAFNSSFLALQALFSMKFLLGRSLHSVNGFFVWVLLCYGLLSMKTFRVKRFMVSDGLRLSAFFLVSYILYMSSPNTDLMSSGMMIYILIKWTSMWEEGEKYQHLLPYGLLCVLGVWAATLKVSSGAIAIMTIFIAFQLIKTKQWKNILVYLCSGMVVALPWVVRNVIISGYMVYPYGAMDLFDVDWKIPAELVQLEQAVTTACARGTYLGGSDVIETSFGGWIPIWFHNQKLLFQILFIVSVIAIFVGLVRCLMKIKHDKDYEYVHILLTMLICFGIWFWGAPDVRFAPACTTMISFFVFGEIYQCLQFELISRYIVILMAFLCVACNARFLYRAVFADKGNLIYSTNYEKLDAQLCEWNGYRIYYPIEGSDQIGYDWFPSTPYISNLDHLELRGKKLQDGFKRKTMD